MAERFTKLFALDKPRYVPGAPVMVMAGALLHDSYSDNYVCQLKLRSLSDLNILSATVLVEMLDVAGAPVGEEKLHQYLDLQVQRGEEFGQDTAIVLPRRDVRAFHAYVSELIFEDNSRWRCDQRQWLALDPPRSLEEAYTDPQLAEQFRIRYGNDCRYMPEPVEDLWYCTCGATNHEDEASCHRCHRVLSALREVNTDALRQESSFRQRLEQDKLQQDKAETKAKNRRWLKLAVILIPLLILAAGLLSTVPGYVARDRSYAQAMALLEQRQFDRAILAFRELGEYRDSVEQAEKNVPYEQGLYLMDRAGANDATALRLIGASRTDLSEGQSASLLLYQGAIEQFEALGDYKDSKANIELCREGIEQANLDSLQSAYENAVQLLQQKRYSQARQAFLALGGFSDSAFMAEEAAYQKATALYDFIMKYDTRDIYAEVSLSPDRESSFSLPKDLALKLGSQAISELREACGADRLDVEFTDTPAGSQRPLHECVNAMYTLLGEHRDSQSRIEAINNAMDKAKDFYMLLEAGDIFGAEEWLNNSEDALEDLFDDPGYWRGLLEMYKPYCGTWNISFGDSTVIPLTVSINKRCTTFSSRVIVDVDAGTATLRLAADDGEGYDYSVDLRSELDDVHFVTYDDEGNGYLAVLASPGHMSYIKYSPAGAMRSSCEYIRA